MHRATRATPCTLRRSGAYCKIHVEIRSLSTIPTSSPTEHTYIQVHT